MSHLQPKYDRIFNDLNPVNGKVSGSAAKNEMVKSKLPNSVWLKNDFLSNIKFCNFISEKGRLEGTS